jgi:small multidrug resistance pump
MRWLALASAILMEVSATLSLRMSTVGRRAWLVPVVAGYAGSFVMLSLALRWGLTIGVAYGIWTAVGVSLTAVASRVLFKEPLTWLMAAGIVLIAGGVLLLEIGAGH